MMRHISERDNEIDRDIALVFVNGVFADELSNTSLLPPNFYEQSMATDELVLTIPEDFNLTSPIRILFIGAHTTYARPFSYKLIAKKNSQVILVEEHRASEVENSSVDVTTQIFCEAGAKVFYYKSQSKNPLASHTANLTMHQSADSQVKAFFIMKGTQTINQEIQVNLMERGAQSELYGLYMLEQNQQKVNCHIHVDHVAPHTSSKMLFKGTLAQKSYSAFTGKVFVHQNAHHISAHQENHNLLLSPLAEVSSKPELEIYADDVKCTHGATVGQIDTEALFYLQSRGIAKDEAMKLLVQAFNAEIFSHVEHEPIKQALQKRIEKHEPV